MQFLTLGVLGGVPIMPLHNPCLDKSSVQASRRWCNQTLPIDVRVSDMLSRMTLAEKIASLDTEAPEIKSLGLNAYNWWSEATHRVSHVNFTGSTPAATNTSITSSARRGTWRMR